MEFEAVLKKRKQTWRMQIGEGNTSARHFVETTKRDVFSSDSRSSIE